MQLLFVIAYIEVLIVMSGISLSLERFQGFTMVHQFFSGSDAEDIISSFSHNATFVRVLSITVSENSSNGFQHVQR